MGRVESGPQEPVTPKPKSVVGLNNPDFPEVSGRTRFDTALELAATQDPRRPIDWSLFRSVNGMDNGGE